MSQDLFFLTDIISDCSGFQFRSWFAVRGSPPRATLLRADPAHHGGMAAVAASEKVARYIFKSDIDSCVLIGVYTLAT